MGDRVWDRFLRSCMTAKNWMWHDKERQQGFSGDSALREQLSSMKGKWPDAGDIRCRGLKCCMGSGVLPLGSSGA